MRPESSAGQSYETRLADYGKNVNAPYVQFLKRAGLALDIRRARGCLVYDAAGESYLDCIAGYGNCNIGHNHPRVIDAVVQEISSERAFNLPFISEAQTRLAQRLDQVSPGDLEHSFVVNSGSEAVESAIKLARLGNRKPGIVATSGAWHGFTLGAMSVSDPAMCAGFQPLLSGVTHVPYGDLAALRAALTDRTSAVIVEPVQAESGAIVPGPGYLSGVVESCRERDVAVIFDEVKCGMAKTGSLFACEADGAVPDVLVSGKSLGGGVMPVGAITARKALWSRFGYSFPMSASSGAGNAAACAAGLATLDVIEDEDLCGRAARAGEILLRELRSVAKTYPDTVADVSGRGLLTAVHTKDAATAMAIVKGCIRRNVLVMLAFGDRSRILVEPPLCVSDVELDQLAQALRDSARDVAHSS